MFRCTTCQLNSQAKDKPNKVTLESRDRVYKDQYGEVEGVGWEIAKEGFLCNRCKTNKEKLNGRDSTLSYPERVC